MAESNSHPTPRPLVSATSVWDGCHPCTLSEDQLLQQCQLTQTRRGGPGGQHRNKVESAIVLIHQPTGVSGQAGERRSQHQNRGVALHRLRINLALAIRAKRSPDSPPSTIWLKHLKGKQIKVNDENFDFPAIMAEALDCLQQAGFDLEIASQQLLVSKSQLVKLLKQEPAAFKLFNQRRGDLGLPPLK